MASSRTAATTPLDHPHLTSIGLFLEAHAGVVDVVGRRLEAEHGISGQPFEVLIRLARTPGQRLRMTDLALQTTLSASGLTRVVDRLVAAGLVERASCPSDRRGTFAVLTPEGEARLLATIPQHLQQVTEVLEAAFDADEIETFTALMRRLRDVVHPGATSVSADAPCSEG